jgi:hypothetical protein
MPATIAMPEFFSPSLHASDPLAEHWLRQVTLHLRREICWLWRERRTHPSPDSGATPPFIDRLEHSLDLARYSAERHRFFAEDETAAYLTRGIAQGAPSPRQACVRGSFSWVARELKLTDAGCFLLALAISPVMDSAAGPVYAACSNDPARPAPTLGLAQRLWKHPAELFTLANPAHPLYTHGLLAPVAGFAGVSWEAPLQTHALVAERLLEAKPDSPCSLFQTVAPACEELPEEAAIAGARLRREEPGRLRIVPVIGARGAPLSGFAAALGAQAGLEVATLGIVPPGCPAESWLGAVLTLGWQCGVSLYVELEGLLAAGDAHGMPPAVPVPLPALPVTLFVGLRDRALLKRLPPAHLLPPVTLAPSTYRQRRECWTAHLPGRARDRDLEQAIAETARRFRYEQETITGICRDLACLGRPIRPADLLAACRADIDLGELAQPVAPRFEEKDLMLPEKQSRQVREITHAMRVLTTVHYEWGTDRAWNESGLTALFAGPPGTGKTMCAEVIAGRLSLPLFRIDLSQVVNKYIGETEKNLKRLFDAAEACDVILFFDEADSLFGKRTEVKDAHDRYANLEVSYLLERMERFKGLAILATNRKKDLDEAFLRRLRFLIDFPLPGVEERLRIWKQVMPAGVDVTGVDFDFLARRFPLAGGHIRSVVFHACLQAADPASARKLTMEALIASVKREFDKLDRAMSLDQYGAYAPVAQLL